MLNLGSDSVTKQYTHVPLEIVQRVKAQRYGFITVSTVPMPKSRDTFRLTIKASKHSWLASNEAMTEFFTYLSDEDKRILSMLKA